MKNKKTKIKIKRSKVNLYNKKKNKTRQVVAVIITAAAACALCILGYGIGKPLMDYFRNRGSTSAISSAWTPGSFESSAESSGAPATGSAETSSQGEAQEPVPSSSKSAYYLSEAATLSTASLNSELAAAKTSGHSVVVVTLKDSEGFFLYSSAIENVSCKSTLSAAQICAEIEKAGLIPAAKISTIKDRTNGVALGCCFKFSNGTTWIDERPGVGKTWLSPFDQKTLDFVKNITAELSAAGFKRIIAADNTFPNFFAVDIKTNLAHLPLSDRSKRAKALWDVVNSAKAGAEAGGAELFVEMDGASLLLEKKDGTDAEMAFDAALLKTANIIVDYSPTEADAYNSAKSFIESLKTALDGAECIIRIKSSSPSIIESAMKAFSESEIEAFSQ